MNSTVTLPAWAFFLLATLVGWAALVLVFAPGMRWFFRRRINRFIGKVNSRLHVELPSFKLTRRQVLIDWWWKTMRRPDLIMSALLERLPLQWGLT